MKIICTSGYFDPLHVGHLELFNAAKKLGDKLVVIVNNDVQARLKKGKAFMPEDERVKIIKALSMVDAVVLSEDTDRTVLKTLAHIQPDVFAKGGDSKIANTPETALCKLLGIDLRLGIGGGKIQSSSWLTALNEKKV